MNLLHRRRGRRNEDVRKAAAGLAVAGVLRDRAASTATLVALLALAGAAEGLGVLTLFPLLDVALLGNPATGAAERTVVGLLEAVGARPTLAVLLVTLSLAILLKGLLRWLAMCRVAATVAGLSRELRVDLVRALLGARWDHLGSQRSGDVATAVGRDAFWAAYAYRHACATLAAGVQAAVYATVLLLVSWQLGMLAVVGAAALALPLGVFVRQSRRAGVDQTAGARGLASGLLEVVGGLKTIRAMGRRAEWLPVLEGEAAALERAERRQVVAAEALKSFQEPLLVLLLAPAVWLAITRAVVPPAALLVGVLLFHRLISHTVQVQAEYQAMVAAEAAFRAVREQTKAARAARDQPPGRRPPPALRDSAALREVTLVRGGRPVLSRVSLEVPAGLLTVLVGPSGAGKTTLVDLFLGLHRPDAGAVEVDGVPLDEIDLEAWSRHVGYVPQETFLLHDTVARNVALGAEVPRERIEGALRRAGAWSFVAAQPRGLDTVVGERGARLSGGERQRVALARALLHDPRLLVLDEATSELDAATEAELCRTLRELRGEVTILATSHRPALADAADRLYEIRGGVVHPLRDVRRLVVGAHSA